MYLFFIIQTWILIFVSSFVFAGFMAVIIPFLYGYFKNDNDQGEGITVKNQIKSTQKSSSSLEMIGKALMYTFAIFTQHGSTKR